MTGDTPHRPPEDMPETMQRPNQEPPPLPASAGAPPRLVKDKGRISATRLLGRLFLCSFAFLLAVFAASFVGVFGLFRGLEGDRAYEVAYWSSVLLGGFTVAAHAALPFGAFIIVSEAFRMRQIAIHGFAGLAVALWLIAGLLETPLTFSDRRVMIACGAGIVGGFVYWLVAGRRAGAFREPLYQTASAGGASGPHVGG